MSSSAQIRFPVSLLAGIDGHPLTDLIIARRWAAGLTQEQAAELLYTSKRAYQQWEHGDRAMHPAVWALFLILTERYVRDGAMVENNH